MILKSASDQPPDPKHLAAELIAAKLQNLDWEVSYQEPGNIFADRLKRD